MMGAFWWWFSAWLMVSFAVLSFLRIDPLGVVLGALASMICVRIAWGAPKRRPCDR